MEQILISALLGLLMKLYAEEYEKTVYGSADCRISRRIIAMVVCAGAALAFQTALKQTTWKYMLEIPALYLMAECDRKTGDIPGLVSVFLILTGICNGDFSLSCMLMTAGIAAIPAAFGGLGLGDVAASSAFAFAEGSAVIPGSMAACLICLAFNIPHFQRHKKIAFGPYLAAGFALVLLLKGCIQA